MRKQYLSLQHDNSRLQKLHNWTQLELNCRSSVVTSMVRFAGPLVVAVLAISLSMLAIRGKCLRNIGKLRLFTPPPPLHPAQPGTHACMHACIFLYRLPTAQDYYSHTPAYSHTEVYISGIHSNSGGQPVSEEALLIDRWAKSPSWASFHFGMWGLGALEWVRTSVIPPHVQISQISTDFIRSQASGHRQSVGNVIGKSI